MATLLLIIIYIAFIGLGIPDSLFGPAWPGIYTEFNLPISFANFITVICPCGTILSSFISAKLIEKLGTSKVCLISTLTTALTLLGFSFSPNIWVMCLLSLPLGLGAGAIDVALNNYVALHYSATHMSFLHCFYGIGVTLSPYIMSAVISTKAGWRGGYKIAFGLQLLISLILLLSLPLWGKVKHKTTYPESEEAHNALGFTETLKLPGVKSTCMLFFSSCAIEFMCGNWGSTYLVEHKHLTADIAARIITFYYIGIALGRFLSGVLAAKISCEKIVKIGQCVLGVAIMILLIPGPVYFSIAGLFLVGLGNGPLFPNLNYLTPQNFGEKFSQSVVSVQMCSSYVGILVGPFIFSLIGQTVGMVAFPFYILALFCVMAGAAITFNRFKKTKEL